MRNSILSWIVVCSWAATPFAIAAQDNQTNATVSAPARQDATQALADALKASKSDQERTALLENQRQLVTPKLAQILLQSGGALRLRGDYAAAATSYALSQKVAEQIGDRSGIAAAIRSLGIVQRLEGNYAGAIALYQKTLALYEELGDKKGIGRSLTSIGIANRALGNYSEALANYQKALAIFEAIKATGDIADVHDDIGIVYGLQGQYDLAFDALEKALEARKTADDKDGIATSLLNIGTLYGMQQKNDQALEYLQQSLKLHEDLKDKQGIVILLGNIGDVYGQEDKPALALEQYQKSLALAQEMHDQENTAIALNNIAEAKLRQHDDAGAAEFADRSAKTASEIGLLETVWRALETGGKAYRRLNDPARAQQGLEESIHTIEALRAQVGGGEEEQQGFLEDKMSAYEEMVGLLADDKRPIEALVYSERAKGRTLLDVLKHGRIRITKAMTPTEQEREEQLERQLVLLNSRISAQKSAVKAEPAALAELDATLKKSRLEYDAFHMELYAAHPELKAQRGEIEISPATVESASSMLLSSDVALLEYEMGEQESYLFALTSKGAADEKELKTYRIAIASKELRQKAERFREQLAQRNLDFRKSSRDLYKLLLQPAKAQLAGRHTLILIPDGPLWNLPFQALIAENNRYLLEDYAIGYAPSLTVLREMIRSRERNNGVATSLALLAMGNPAIGKATSDRLQVAFRDEKLEPLPDAETEVKTLGQLYGGKSEVYVGAQAREDRFKAEAGKAAILHLATHGFLSDSNPMYSHLVLSADEKGTEDGLLETREIMDLDLKADLAVLSACESGRGKVGAGEGLIGLSWAFFIAGVPTTVASQWKVESESTTKLMLAFHRSLKQEHGSALATARSLQAAALKLLHDPQYAHPFYWAGFVVVGNPN